MNAFIKSSLLLFSFLSLISCGQKYFEGEIIYDVEYIKKDSAFDLSNLPSWPSKTARSLVKNGSWIQSLEGSNIIQFEFFNKQQNQQIYKIRASDTLIYLDYSKLQSDLAPVTSIKTMKGTDTILGKVCDKLILQSSSLTLTLLYDSDYLKIDPDWYINTKGGYYNVIYPRTKSLYLKAIVETDKFISIIKARKVKFKEVPDEAFTDIASLPKRKVE
jgi:hypothetical protein